MLKNTIKQCYYWLINSPPYLLFVRGSKLLSRKGIYPYIDQQFSEIKTSSNVLNVGAGGRVNDMLNDYANKNGFTVVSQDIDEKRNPDILGDICTLPLEPETYDVISICEVLEHLHSPHLAIENMFCALKPEGKIIITVPFIFPMHERPFDYYRYTKYGLAHLLSNFEEVKIKERNSWGETINVLFVRHIMNDNVSSKLAAPALVTLGLVMAPLFWLMGKLIRSDYITTGYLVSARKASHSVL